MTPERSDQIKTLFDSAIKRPPVERSAFLADACGNDEDLKREVESLLVAHEKDGSFIDSPAYKAEAETLVRVQDLKPGQSVGHYQIVSTLGKGGMGEVYLARDTRLDRRVALKVLPLEFTTDKGSLRRFEQEARAASALNHPSILTIHDIGELKDLHYIAMEFVEGQTLRAHLQKKNSLPVSMILKVGVQVAEALSAAHLAGIIHRDIKPENIMLRTDGYAKVLDFGLAKLSNPRALIGPEDHTRPLTVPGIVLGTVFYMSPEQASGHSTDARTDIWSLGVVLYEMVARKLPFSGDTVNHTIVAILENEPQELATAPQELRRIIRKALTKDVDMRYQSARDLLIDLRTLSRDLESQGGRFHSVNDRGVSSDGLSGPSSSSRSDLGTSGNVPVSEKFSWRDFLPWIVAGVFALTAAVALGFVYLSHPTSTAKLVRLSFNPPSNLSFNDVINNAAVISPDGEKIAFTAVSADGKAMLYVRGLNSTDAKLLLGSENAIEPFWSPDSRSVVYGSNGKLKRSDLSGGNAQVLCDSAHLTGGSWNSSGVIVFEPDYRMRLMQVPASGGEPQYVQMNVDDKAEEIISNPIFLPDGRKFLFKRQSGQTQSGIWSGSLDSPQIKQVVSDFSPFAFSPEGWLVFVHNDALVAQSFDPASAKVSGDPIPIISGLPNAMGTQRRFSVSVNGILVWQGEWERSYQLVWFDREGKQVGTVESPIKARVGQDPRISPDGRHLLIKTAVADQSSFNLWVVDLEKNTNLRITSTFSQIPIWSPDGNRIAYNAGTGIAVKRWNGLGDPEFIHAGTNFPSDWSPDGRFLIFLRDGVNTRMDMYSLSMTGERKETLLLNSAADEKCPVLSPDGKWLAYASDDTGVYEIYVQSFSVDGTLGVDRKRISTAGGKFAVWRRDGTELFFISADGQMMSSTVKTSGADFEFSTPKPLFKTHTLFWNSNFHEFDVSPDGQRFLIGTLVGEPTAPPPTVMLNWTSELKK